MADSDVKSDAEHWNGVYTSKEDQDLGWYEDTVEQTLRFVEAGNMQLYKGKTFLAGVGTSTLADVLLSKLKMLEKEVLRGGGAVELILNDISSRALGKLRTRLEDDKLCRWMCQDMAEPLKLEAASVDLWIDRAVLHFLVEEEAIQQYFANLNRVLKPGGAVLFAEFAKDGAEKCAGLLLRRYSQQELQQRLGSDYRLLRSESYIYTNPSGGKRPYLYALYERTG